MTQALSHDDQFADTLRRIIREEVRPIIREEVRPIVREIVREEVQDIRQDLGTVKLVLSNQGLQLQTMQIEMRANKEETRRLGILMEDLESNFQTLREVYGV